MMETTSINCLSRLRKEKYMLRKVVNVSHTSNNPLPSGFVSWRKVWTYYSRKQWPYYCPVPNCYERAEVGAHVRIYGDTSGAVYIVPLCYSHNNDHDACFYVDDSMLVRIK